jgi:hypothetical protein
MRTRTGEESVSVIVGTLLLILITVTAAAGLALMVSQMQKDEMNRQTHLNAVKNENITILNVAFENNQTEWPGVQNSQNWSSARLTLVNMNTDDVRIMGIAINDHYALNFTDKSRTDPYVSSRTIFNGTNYLTIPATKSQDVVIDFVANASDDPTGLTDYSQSQSFGVGNPQNIKIGTSLTNFFETTLKTPNPVYKMSIESENLGTIQRDVLLLDGSGSTADNSIVRWNWTLYDRSLPALNLISNNPLTNWSNATYSGKTVRITTLNNTPNYWGTLTVIDDIGMSATSDQFAIPPDTQFSPPMSLQWDPIPKPDIISGPDCPESSPGNTSCILNPTSYQWSRVINASLYDLNNNPIKDTPIIFSIDNNPNTISNCFSIVQMAVNTGSDGKGSTAIMQSNITLPICPQSVTMHAQAGKLISPTILIPGIT